MRRKKPLPGIGESGKQTATQEGQAELLLTGLGNGDSHDGKGWELVTSGTRRMAPAPPADLHLQTRACALVAGEGLGAVSHKAADGSGRSAVISEGLQLTGYLGLGCYGETAKAYLACRPIIK